MQLAKYISLVTEPMLMLIGLALIGAWQCGIRGISYILFVSYAALMSGIVAFVRLRVMSLLNTNWDISDRKKRVQGSIIFLVISVVASAALLLWHNAALLRLAGEVIVWYALFALITTKVKISGHLGVVTLVIGYLCIWYGWIAAPLFMALPFVAWSRLTLKRHTRLEVVGGTLYSALFLYVTAFLIV